MIVAKVADLLDERTLVLNRGSEAGIKEGMRFMIYASQGKKITDPDTKKELGVLKISKRAVEVIEVHTNYSVAETFRYKTVNEGGTNSAFRHLGGYLSPPRYVRKYETFSIEDTTKKEIDEQKSIVKIGDLAEQIEDTQEEES